MSNVSDILTARIDLRRLTALVLDTSAVASSISPTRQPATTARLEVTVVGATVASGLVNIAGSTTETFNFSANGIKVGTRDFTSISGITISGISQGFIRVRAVSAMGQPVNKEITVASSMPVRFFEQNGRIKIHKPGEEAVSKIYMMAEPTADVKNNDIAYVLSGLMGITVASLDFVQGIFDFDGATHHIECNVNQP